MTFHTRMKVGTRAMIAMAAASLVATSAAAQAPLPTPPHDPSFLTTPAFADIVNARSIVIFTRDGRNYEGRFKISGNALVKLDSMTDAATSTTVPLADVARVQKSTYRIRMHTWIGVGVGVAAGGVVGAVLCGGDCDGDPFWLALAAVGAGAGAGIGAGVGASQNARHFEEDIVYDIGQRFAPVSGAAPFSRLGTAEFAREIEGKDVRVTTADGTKRRGAIAVATASGLILTGPQHASLPYTEIRTISEVSHRIRNGVLNGLGAGASLSLLHYYITAVTCFDGPETNCGAKSLAFTALGAGAGAAVGALMNLQRDRDLLFDAARKTTTVAFTPLVSKTRKGVAVVVTWR